MKKKLLTLFAAGAMGLPMCATFYMCVKLNSSDIIKYEVEEIEEVTYSDSISSAKESFMKIKMSNGDSIKYDRKEIAEVYYEKIVVDTTAIGDTTIVDAESTPLTFKVLSESTVEISGYLKNYFVDEDGVIEEKTITIPANVIIDSIAYNVVGIGNSAFSSCIGLSRIDIPSTVTYIGDRAFNSCKGLKKIDLSSKLEYIGEEAFQNCTGLTTILIPSTVTDIKEWAFYGCRNLDIVIDNYKDAVTIGAEGFSECKSVTFAKGDFAPVDATKTNLAFNVLSDSTAKVIGINSTLVDSVIIPANIQIDGKAYTVTRIGEGSLSATDANILKSVVLPSTITEIEDQAFSSAEFDSFNIPSSVERIGKKAFSNCQKLKTIDIPANVSYIGDDAFIGCTNLESINVQANSENFTSIDGVLYNDTQSEIIKVPGGMKNAVVIPTTVKKIEDAAFHSCSNLTKINIPSNVNTIGDSAFFNCINLEISIDNYKDSISIGEKAFDGCKSVTFKKSIYDQIFTDSNTHLEYKIISDGAVEITGGCTSTLSIPDSIEIEDKLYSVASIGEKTFTNCDSLTSIEIPSSVVTIGKIAFMGCSKLESVNIPSGITTISDSLFKDCDSLRSIRIPGSVNHIGDFAFGNCKNLNVVIENYEDSITYGNAALRDCKSVTYTKIDSSIVNISDSPLNFKITSDSTATISVCDANKIYGPITVPEKVRIDHKIYVVNSISKGAFQQCMQITSVVLPKTITTIEEDAFDFCKGMASINLPSGLTFIGENAFIDCSNLKNITIPSSVLTIGNMAFAYCSNLYVTVDNKQENIKIGNNAFYDCKSVKYSEE